MKSKISLRDGLVKFYSNKNIKVEFLTDFPIKAAGIIYINGIKYCFVIPVVSENNFSYIDNIYHIVKPKGFDLSNEVDFISNIKIKRMNYNEHFFPKPFKRGKIKK